MADEVWDSIIIGSGPAGCTAALYNARAGLKTLVIAGFEAGGQLMLTSDVENYPGYPDGVQGPDMMADFRKQAERFGAKFVDEDADEADFTHRPFDVKTSGGTYKGHGVIVATGSSAKWLDLESETRLRGKGVSACATCDAFFFKEKHVAVVGGGDTAMEEATFLTKFASKVTVVHRRSELRASKIMQQRARDNAKIDFVWNAEVTEVLGKGSVEGLRLKDTESGDESTLECQGLFVAIGHTPNTDRFKGQVHLDERGYIVSDDRHGTHTNIEGVFVAGDVQDHRYMQAVTAAGQGCKAAIDLERWLEEQGEIEARRTEKWTEHPAA